MSFEGYYQTLCEKGHAGAACPYTEDGWEHCYLPNCRAKIVWSNRVDQTNGCSHEDYPPEKAGCCPIRLETKEPAKVEICPTCKHTCKILEEETYKIPEGRGTRHE